jgi:BirA family biotin operon repressor/biotin-[acetyl-CoA-carboxylase] ligase
MGVRDELIRALADGRVHSGRDLAAALGVSRSAVWKQAHRLGALGLELAVEGRRGYRLLRPVELLDAARISAALEGPARATCESLRVAGVIDSTSARLAAEPAPAPGAWRAILAEFQTGGRGRRGRRWLSPYGSGLCLSVAWSFVGAPRELPALSLAAGIAVVRALAAAGAVGLALKWPNDVVLGGAKLGGLLVDVDGDARGPLRAVVGAGINLAVPAGLAAGLAGEAGLPPAALEDALPGAAGRRNELAARLCSALAQVLAQFSGDGFGPFADEWRRHDWLFGRSVSIRQDGNEATGVARGIAPDGALLVEGPGGLAAVLSGDVTVRPAA